VTDISNLGQYWLHGLLLGVGISSSDTKQR